MTKTLSLSRLLFCVGMLATGCAQQPPTIKQDSKGGACSNIVALTGNVTLNCSTLTKAQEKLISRIPELLAKILENQMDPDAVMAKLDEILKAVNPNNPPRVYLCEGEWRYAGPGPTAGMVLQMGGDRKAHARMLELNNTGQYQELLSACTSSLKETPEWLTPYLFCGMAHLAMGHKEEAADMLAKFDQKRGPAYDAGTCKEMADFLRLRTQ